MSPADEQADRTGTGEIIAFDIPPQSLLMALRSYSEVTGQAVLVDNSLTTGRQSPGVHGDFDKATALQILLAGTGLIASYTNDQAFTLKLAEPGESSDTVVRERSESFAGGGIDAVTERYAGKIQRPIEAALCQSNSTRPGSYRLALQIWIAPSGQIEKTNLLSPADGLRHDDDVRRALNKLLLDPPPPGMPQPITLLLLPEHPAKASACAVAAKSQH
ncbi:TonB-dependent outer membrane receptor [Dyella lipolytica]|uniref:TonB C-terminal domain-containing protein n=1 Tax=Dyella lipolytica TaxID=1867835 RepID=A0ABW8IXS9_9GAMM|nr:STN domain-containing protein [Dyella lipolytica]GLQ45886.1 TonB-dependent outer membrane receptor [Dyella lipolytica]